MKSIRTELTLGCAAIAIALVMMTTAVAAPANGSGLDQISKKVRHELVMLPYYGVFDNLAYKVDGSTVTLYGEVVRPITRSDAAGRVARINGVTRVINNIKVLPLSSFDDSIRLRTYRAIFSSAGLHRYALGANPSIHIIVDRGHVTLEGVVSSNMDRTLAYMAANRVSGVFSVKNNLRLENEMPG